VENPSGITQYFATDNDIKQKKGFVGKKKNMYREFVQMPGRKNWYKTV